PRPHARGRRQGVQAGGAGLSRRAALTTAPRAIRGFPKSLPARSKKCERARRAGQNPRPPLRVECPTKRREQTMPILWYIAMGACALGTASEMASCLGPPRLRDKDELDRHHP